MEPNEMEITSHPLMPSSPPQFSAWVNAPAHGTSTPVPVYQGQPAAGVLSALAERADWQDEGFRQAYMEATVEQDIAWQIAINRKQRQWTQDQFAELLGSSQSAIARMEDPCYGRHSLATLVKVAHAFDCALRVKLIPYSKLADEVNHRSEADLKVATYAEETEQLTFTE